MFAINSPPNKFEGATRPGLQMTNRYLLMFLVLMFFGCATAGQWIEMREEAMLAISQDGEYAIMRVIHPQKNTYSVHSTYLVRMLNFEENQYEILDSVPVFVPKMPFLSNHSLTYYELKETQKNINILDFDSVLQREILITGDSLQNSNNWLFDIIDYQLAKTHSGYLIAYWGPEDSLTLLDLNRVENTIEVLLNTNGAWPSYNHDGTMLYFKRFTCTVDSLNCLYELYCYDIVQNLISLVTTSSNRINTVQYDVSDSKFYYIKETLTQSDMNIFSFSANIGETQITHYNSPLKIFEFTLIGDSLYCLLGNMSNNMHVAKYKNIIIPLVRK